jgi:hypothetical protein
MPDDQSKTTRPDTVEVSISGPVDGMGTPDPSGSYLRLRIATPSAEHFHRISLGAAEVLAAELMGLLHDA